MSKVEEFLRECETTPASVQAVRERRILIALARHAEALADDLGNHVNTPMCEVGSTHSLHAYQETVDQIGGE